MQHLLRHNQYSSFEEFYLSVTRSFYLSESKSEAERLKDEPKQFFKNMQDCIESEVQRVKTILPITTWNLVREVTEQALWGGRMDWLAHSSKPFVSSLCIYQSPIALPSYLAEKDFASLGKMYTLFARVGGSKAISTAFREHIKVRLRLPCPHLIEPVMHSLLYLTLLKTRDAMTKWFNICLTSRHWLTQPLRRPSSARNRW